MTTSVCPACRTPISLYEHACPRCGLAVRPTCSSCGEALEVRMHACPRCWEVIEHQAPYADTGYFHEAAVLAEPEAETVAVPQYERSHEVAESNYPYEAHARSSATVTAEAPVLPADAVAPAPPKRRRKLRIGRLLFIGLFAGVIVSGGLLALEAVGPRLRGSLPDQVSLERQGFPALDFAIDAPAGWDTRTSTVDGRDAAIISEPPASRGVGEREIQVVLDDRPLDRARLEAEERGRSEPGGYDHINVIGGIRLDGRPAVRHQYIQEDAYRETWWVERGDGTYRIDFFSPIPRREESALLFVRIARTFDVL